MTLGERIYKLRTEKEMSQGDLADALDVSRQSISKWETNGSVPELDKLVKLSDIFCVSLDELILDKKQAKQAPMPEPPEPKVIYVERQAPSSAQRTIGVVLLCFAALVWLMIALFGDIIAGLVLAAPFVACGLICLLVKKNAGLWCTWVVYLFIEIYLRFATGINWHFLILPHMYDGEWRLHLIVAWCLLTVLIILTFVTALRSRKVFPGCLRNDLIGAVSGWAVYLITGFLFTLPAYEAQNAVVYSQSYRYISAVSGWFRSIVMAVALVFTIRSIASFLVKRKR